MANFESCTFKNVVQELDGNSFKKCIFENTKMIYRGGQPPNFDRCEFKDSPFVFEDAAGNTVGFLQAMSNPRSGVSQIVRDLFSLAER